MQRDPRETDHLIRSGTASVSQSDRYGLSHSSSRESSTAVSFSGGDNINVEGASAKPLGHFRYLDKEYGREVPSCLIPRINELFKSICERYDVAVTNREKVDQALQLFKRVLGLERDTPLAECFAAWRSYLSSPVFTVSYSEPSGDVKGVTVRAEDIPRDRRKAQKHLRDLLDACNLFLQQRAFLQQHIRSDMAELERLAKDLPTLAKEARLSSSERKQLPRTVRRAQAQFASYPRVIDQFWSQVYSLMHEIKTSVYVLQEQEQDS